MSGSRRVGTALKLLTFEFVLRKVVKLQLPFFLHPPNRVMSLLRRISLPVSRTINGITRIS